MQVPYLGLATCSSDGQRIAIANSTTVSILDWSGKLISSFRLPEASSLQNKTWSKAISFSADGKQIVTVQSNGTVQPNGLVQPSALENVWVQDTSGKVLNKLTRQQDPLESIHIDLSPDDQQLAIANQTSGTVQIWQIAKP